MKYYRITRSSVNINNISYLIERMEMALVKLDRQSDEARDQDNHLATINARSLRDDILHDLELSKITVEII